MPMKYSLHLVVFLLLSVAERTGCEMIGDIFDEREYYGSFCRDCRLACYQTKAENALTVRSNRYVFEVHGVALSYRHLAHMALRLYKNVRYGQCRRIASGCGGATSGVRYPADPKSNRRHESTTL